MKCVFKEKDEARGEKRSFSPLQKSRFKKNPKLFFIGKNHSALTEEEEEAAIDEMDER